jgi:hypothetical protein
MQCTRGGPASDGGAGTTYYACIALGTNDKVPVKNCTKSSESYVAPAQRDGVVRITDDDHAINECGTNSTKCYSLPGQTVTTTPHSCNDSSPLTTELDDQCDVIEDLTYSNGNTNNYTYYSCTQADDGTAYYLRKDPVSGSSPYFKGLKEDVGQPATGNTLATGLFLAASQAETTANTAVTTANTAVTTANTAAATANTVSGNLATLTTNVNKLGDALLGTSVCRASSGGGTGLGGISSGSETNCSTDVTLTSVLMSYFDSMCSNGNAACTASTSLQQLLQNSTSLPSTKENN